MENNDYTGMLSKRISELRRRSGMTQDALADKLGVTFQAVSKWERGQSCPDISLLPNIAEIFGVSVDEMFREAPAEDVQPEAPSDVPETEEKTENASSSGYEKRKIAEEKRRKVREAKLSAEGFEAEADSIADEKQSFKKVIAGDILNSLGKKFSSFGSGFGGAKRGNAALSSDLIPQNDGRLRVLVFIGDRLAEQHELDGLSDVAFRYDGEALDVISMLSVNCGDIGEDASAGTHIQCGDINGDASAGGYIECGDVGGDASAGSNIECGDIAGNADAGGDIECGDILGSAKAEGDINCAHIGRDEDD